MNAECEMTVNKKKDKNKKLKSVIIIPSTIYSL